jgi:zinc/manganese transport system substrate-binding protein
MQRVRLGLAVVTVAAICGLAGPAAEAASTKISVVAAEDFWGSIVRQLGGEHAEVTSLIADPDTEPHDYEAKPSDAAAVARSQVAIVNGIGYDGFMSDLLGANPSSSRKVVTVGDVVGLKEGANPHQWYSPKTVSSVIDAVTAALKQADPADASYFDAQRQAFRTDGLKRYNELRTRIKETYSGLEVGASESIFAPLAEDLGLNLVTPESFIDAVSEGNEPTAKDKATVDKQITSKQIKVFVYNAQNSTPDVEALLAKAKKAGVPVTNVTETISPVGAAFQDWQANQLQSLADALAHSTGRSFSVNAAQAPAPAATAADEPTSPAAAESAPSDAAAPSSALASTGSSARWLVLLAGAAFVLGGLGLAGGPAARRNRSTREAHELG